MELSTMSTQDAPPQELNPDSGQGTLAPVPRTPDWPPPPDFSDWLRARIGRENGITQEDFARDLDFTLSAVRTWLSRRAWPGYEALFRMKQYFGALPWDTPQAPSPPASPPDE